MKTSLRPLLIEEPGIAPIELAEVKGYCRIDHDDDDDLLDALIMAAVAFLDGWSGVLGRCLISQTWQFSQSCWPASFVQLPFPDCSGAVIVYSDADNVERTLSDDFYVCAEGVDGTLIEWSASFSAPALFNRSDAIRIEVTAGYGDDANAVPPSIRLALKMLVALWYERREATQVDSFVDLPFGVRALLAPHRRVGI